MLEAVVSVAVHLPEVAETDGGISSCRQRGRYRVLFPKRRRRSKLTGNLLCKYADNSVILLSQQSTHSHETPSLLTLRTGRWLTT